MNSQSETNSRHPLQTYSLYPVTDKYHKQNKSNPLTQLHFFFVFSAKISIPSPSIHVSYIITLFGALLITKLPIILFHPVLLALPLFTSRYPPCNIFF